MNAQPDPEVFELFAALTKRLIADCADGRPIRASTLTAWLRLATELERTPASRERAARLRATEAQFSQF